MKIFIVEDSCCNQQLLFSTRLSAERVKTDLEKDRCCITIEEYDVFYNYEDFCEFRDNLLRQKVLKKLSDDEKRVLGIKE